MSDPNREGVARQATRLARTREVGVTSGQSFRSVRMSDIEELAHLLDMPGGDLDWGSAVEGEPFCFLEYEQATGGDMAPAAAQPGAAVQGEEQERQPSSRLRPRL